MGGRHYELYSHSFQNYGQDALTRWHERELALEFPRDVVIEDPCMLRGQYVMSFSKINQHYPRELPVP